MESPIRAPGRFGTVKAVEAVQGGMTHAGALLVVVEEESTVRHIDCNAPWVTALEQLLLAARPCVQFSHAYVGVAGWYT